MRARVFVPVFLFAVSLPVFASEEKKEDALKMEMSYLEKAWGIKCKSHRIGESPHPFERKVTFLLEFTKDVENLEELRAAFKPIQRTGAIAQAFGDCPLWFYFFDEDNGFVYKSPPNAVEGELSGKKGDAIRVTIHGVAETSLKKTRKIEARPREKEKDKDKAKK